MAVTSYHFPTANGQIDAEWSSPTNAYADDGAYTAFNAPAQHDFYHFDIESDDIPEGATIDGIEAEFEVYSNGGNTWSIDARLVKDVSGTGTKVGDTKNNTWNAASWVAKTYGGAADKWGTTWTRDDILADKFGIWCDQTASVVGSFRVDYIKIRIYYSTSTAYSRDVSVGIAIGPSKSSAVSKPVSVGVAIGPSKSSAVSKSISVDIGIDKSGHSFVTGYKNPSDNGDLYTDFTDPTNAYSSNNVRATADATGGFVQHDFSGFGFTTADIPDGSTIDGFEVSIEARTGLSSDPQTIGIQMVKGGTAQGDALTNPQTYTTATDTYKVIGSSTDKGALTWDDDDVRAANFGVKVIVTCGGSFSDACLIDHIQVRVYYSFPSVSFVKEVVKPCAVAVALTTTKALSIAKAIAVTLQLTPSKIAAVSHSITAAIALSHSKTTSIVRRIAVAIGLTPSDKKHHFETYPGPTPGTGTGEKVINP